MGLRGTDVDADDRLGGGSCSHGVEAERASAVTSPMSRSELILTAPQLLDYRAGEHAGYEASLSEQIDEDDRQSSKQAAGG